LETPFLSPLRLSLQLFSESPQFPPLDFQLIFERCALSSWAEETVSVDVSLHQSVVGLALFLVSFLSASE